jgi:hypothetical protein
LKRFPDAEKEKKANSKEEGSGRVETYAYCRKIKSREKLGSRERYGISP